MSIPRPKILTAFTVPTGGWILKVYFSVATQYDTPKTATIPAGEYFLAWDGQADDFLRAFNLAVATQTGTLGGANFCNVSLTSENKVLIQFHGADFIGSPKRSVKIAWTESTAALAAALGFDSSADDALTAADQPSFTADWQHAYGWFADEDCQLEFLNTEDINIVSSPQAIGLSGVVKTQLMGSRYRNELRLQYMSRAKTWSKGTSYGAAPVSPYARNVPLECWWQEARKGTRFRVYRDSTNNTSFALVVGSTTASNTTTMTDSTKAWATEPQTYKGMVCYVPDRTGSPGSQAGRFYIASHTATVLTVGASTGDGLSVSSSGATYYIFDNQYQTYVLETGKLSEFNPPEIPVIDRYNFSAPLLRYVS